MQEAANSIGLSPVHGRHSLPTIENIYMSLCIKAVTSITKEPHHPGPLLAVMIGQEAQKHYIVQHQVQFND